MPELRQNLAVIESGSIIPGEMFVVEAQTLQERLSAKRTTIPQRVSKAAEIIAENPDEFYEDMVKEIIFFTVFGKIK